MMSWHRRWAVMQAAVVFGAVVLMTAAGALPRAVAAMWIPAKCADGAGGLVSAIELAQQQRGGSILLSGGSCVYSFSSAYEAGNALPVISTKIAICGNGSSGIPGSTITRASGAPPFRLFEVAKGGSLSLSCQVTLGGGQAPTGQAGSPGANATTVGESGSPGTKGSVGNDGGAVLVDPGGSFTMSSGSITGSRAGTGGDGGKGGDGDLAPGGSGGDAGNGGNGGAVASRGTVLLSGVRIDDNGVGAAGSTPGAGGAGVPPESSGGAGVQGSGSGIYNPGGTVTLRAGTSFTGDSCVGC